MAAFLKGLEQALDWLGGVVWGPPMLVLLIGTHLFLTVRLRLIQRFIGTAIKLSVTREKEGQGDVSQFGALVTALAATIGTGNIVGVATAVVSGGPGAVFWMWLTGVLGFATKYSEALLAVKYRVTNAEGQMAGGPMYAIERGMGRPWLAMTFAFLTAFAGFGIGNMVQANSISSLAKETLGMPPEATGIILAVLTAIVILGGIKSIAYWCEWLVPFMAFFYVGGLLWLLATKISTVPATIALILTSAFTWQAVGGGFLGAGILAAMRFGVARGLFSNESGLGSAPIVAAAAKTRNPVRQALVSATGTFWDTVVICLLTGVMLVNSDMCTVMLAGKDWQLLNLSAVVAIPGYGPLLDTIFVKSLHFQGANFTKMAFAEMHTVGPIILAVGLATFVFSTILGWSYYGEKAAEYLWGTRVVRPYRYAWVLAVFAGSVLSLPIVWSFADVANGMMAIPNLICLLALNGVIVAETRKYLWSGEIDTYAEGQAAPAEEAAAVPAAG